VANLRKLVAAALNSSDLSESYIIETAIDRIGALAFSDALGAELWALKYGGDARSWHPAMRLLSLRTKRAAPSEPIRYRLCRVCLTEWIDENCRSCGGRQIIAASTMAVAHVCTVCNGTGLKRYSDLWRMREMHMDKHAYRRWEHRFAAVHRKIADADTQTWHDLSEQLGRVPAGIIREKVLDLPRRLHILEPEAQAHNENSMPEFVFCSTGTA